MAPCALLLALAVASPQVTVDDVLDAIRVVETGGEPDGGRDAVGDGGRSIGPFQIQRAYWLDAGVPGRYEDCRDPEYARRVVLAYWQRWCPRALVELDVETLARIHNGGPRGDRRASTLAFWRKVSAVLETARERARRSTMERRGPIPPPFRRPAPSSRRVGTRLHSGGTRHASRYASRPV